MSKRWRLLSSAVAATTVITSLVLAATMPSAGAASSGRTITVIGTGQVRGTPDVADLVIGVSGRGGTATDVLARIGDRAQKVIDALKGAGVSDDDIQTADLSVQPVTNDHGDVTGYQATNTVSARIRDLTKAGAIVDAAAAQAGDDIRVQGITFSIDDDSALLAAARTQATKRARAQAEALASGAGVEVGAVRSISETTNTVPLTYGAEAAAPAASTPVMPGSETLSVQARVVFAIR